MKILTLENQSLDLNTLPDQIEEDIRFSVLDNSDPANPDFLSNASTTFLVVDCEYLS